MSEKRITYRTCFEFTYNDGLDIGHVWMMHDVPSYADATIRACVVRLVRVDGRESVVTITRTLPCVRA